jgi:hypothetical protein
LENAQKRHERAPRLEKKLQKLLKMAINRLKRARRRFAKSFN